MLCLPNSVCIGPVLIHLWPPECTKKMQNQAREILNNQISQAWSANKWVEYSWGLDHTGTVLALLSQFEMLPGCPQTPWPKWAFSVGTSVFLCACAFHRRYKLVQPTGLGGSTVPSFGACLLCLLLLLAARVMPDCSYRGRTKQSAFGPLSCSLPIPSPLSPS